MNNKASEIFVLGAFLFTTYRWRLIVINGEIVNLKI